MMSPQTIPAIIMNNTSTTVSTNTTAVSTFESSMTLEVSIASLFILIFMVGCIGNGMVVYYFGVKKDKRRTVPELLFCYLAVVDLGSSLLAPPLYAYWTLTEYYWPFGYWACKLFVPLGPIATTMSGGIFIIVAFDRQRSIVQPFKKHYKEKYIKLSVAFVFLYALALNFHYGINLTIKRGSQCLINDVSAYSYSIPTMISFFIQDCTLIFVFAFTNFRIFSHLKGKDTALVLGALWQKRKKDSARIIRLLISLATVFFVLTLPRDILQFIQIISWLDGRNGIRVSPLLLHIHSFLKVFHTANSCVNVFIYYRMHSKFRQFVNECCCFLTIERNNEDFSNYTVNETYTDDSSRVQGVLRKLGSRHKSNRSQSLGVREIDTRLIDEVNIGRKRAITDVTEIMLKARSVDSNDDKDEEEEEEEEEK